MSHKNAHEERNRKKAVMPHFRRSDSHKKKRLAKSWRRPRGIQSKVRLQRRGYSRRVKIGWGSPAPVKHLTRQGLKEVIVSNVPDIKKIQDKEKQGIVISSSTGTKKKLLILESALKTGIKVLNMKAPEDFIRKAKERLEKKAEEKKEKAKEKHKKAKEKEEAARKKEEEEKQKDGAAEAGDELEKKVDEEEKKKAEKKEIDKALTKKGSI